MSLQTRIKKLIDQISVGMQTLKGHTNSNIR